MHVKEQVKHLGYMALPGEESRRETQRWWEGEVFIIPSKGRGQDCHTAAPSSHQCLLGREQQRLLAQGCPRPRGQAEARAGSGQASAEEAVESKILWHLSDAWCVTGLGQGMAGSQVAGGRHIPHRLWQTAQAAAKHKLPDSSQAAAGRWPGCQPSLRIVGSWL